MPLQVDLPPLWAFLAASGFESALAEELGPVRIDGPRWPSVISTRRDPGRIDPAFARQLVPSAALVRGDSVSALAESVFAALDPIIDASESPLALHVCVPDPQPYRNVQPRVPLLERAFLERLRERRPHASRRLVSSAGGAFGERLVVQLVLVGHTALLASAARPQALPGGGFDLCAWPAGLVPVPDDKRAPSRAYRKLVESFGWIGARPGRGESCVDLGGSPGGWAFTALSGGARVVAVDRSPLAPPALGHPNLEMVLGNAFTYEPRGPVDWMLCDVICDPQRTLELTERWMSRSWCRNVIATLKFKGAGGYAVLPQVRERLGSLGWSFLRLKHMQNHNNEVVILARR